ncbi:DUF2179 domain-containing protein [Spirochaetota bacterium]
MKLSPLEGRCMSIQAIMDSTIFSLVIIPILIFMLKAVDISLDTIRIIFVSKGMKITAPIVGFFQILVWLMAVTQVFKNLDNVFAYFAYAGGYALGVFIGINIDNKLKMGISLVQVITQKDASELIDYLKFMDYRVSSIGAQSEEGEVTIIYATVKRKETQKIIGLVKYFNPNAIYSIGDVREVSDTITKRPLSEIQAEISVMKKDAKKGTIKKSIMKTFGIDKNT